MLWYTGCSGFHYKEWKGEFYPEKLPQRQWFEYYSSRFHTLELNVTFYRFPKVSFLETWYAKSPDHFLFAVKAPRLITHYKKFKGTESLLDDFYATVRKGLADKLGPVLFQLPPQLAYTEESLQQIVESLDPSFDNVIEFRHASWWQKKVTAALAKKQITFCGISYPGLPDEAVVNTGLVYYRFHGVPRLYYSAHSQAEIKQVAAVIGKSRKAKKAFVFFNNTASGAAIENAVFLESLIKQ